MVYYFMSKHYVLPKFVLDSRLVIFGDRNCPFGFLLVVFWLWCRCFKCVLLSLWCLGRRELGNCIDSCWERYGIICKYSISVSQFSLRKLQNYVSKW